MITSQNDRSAASPPMWRMGENALAIAARSVMLIAIAGTFLVAAALLVYGGVETWHLLTDLFSHGGERDAIMLAAIEIVDIFLVATVIQFVSIGLYQLYINREATLPEWLRVGSLDELKAKLTGVVITVLGVFFLGASIAAERDNGFLFLGLSVAAVIVALSYFLSKIKAH